MDAPVRSRPVLDRSSSSIRACCSMARTDCSYARASVLSLTVPSLARGPDGLQAGRGLEASFASPFLGEASGNLA
jgi:hypothetical protein